MPEYAMWSLIVGLIILVLTLILEIVDLRQRLKVSKNEPSRLRSELDMLKEAHDKEISDIKELNKREMKELTEKLKKVHNNSLETIYGVDDTEVELLRIIATLEKPFDDSHTINSRLLSVSVVSLKLSPQDLKYHLERLHKKTNYLDYSPYGDLRGLTYSGRSYLKMRNKLP
jgi:regulator of replication initiation timing